MPAIKSQLPVFITSSRAAQPWRAWYLSAQLLVLCTPIYLLLCLLRPIFLNIPAVVVVPLVNTPILTLACSAATIQYPTLQGAEFLSLEANLVSNYSAYIYSAYYPNHGSVNVTNANFCNVTISYTHPGQNDTLHVQVWMPADTWNGRMQGIGGGGWVAGLFSFSFMGMTAAVGEGYAAVSTDAGLPSEDPREWALLSPGNVNLYNLQNLASVSLNDAAIIGKAVVNSFYGTPPLYSYWNGCSQGGRQGLMLAQRYPDAYNGIAASAPAINWNEFFIGDYWATFVMDQLGEYPHPCEINAITAAVISACDSNDGVIDGVISDPETCDFNPRTLIGTTINCTDNRLPLQISSAAAAVVLATWTGPKSSDNSSLWFGVNPDVVLTGRTGLVGTSCTANDTCIAKPFSLSADWIRLFLLKDANSTLTNMTHGELERLFHSSVQQYSSIIGTSDPDLKEFRDRGGKMLTSHGLSDGIISPFGSKHYYDAVMAGDPGVHDYYRLFFAPGVAHCYGGNGAYPDTTFDSLRAWVEGGVAPDTLSATSLMDSEGRVLKRPLCAYPKKQYYNGTGDSRSGEGFYCE